MSKGIILRGRKCVVWGFTIMGQCYKLRIYFSYFSYVSELLLQSSSFYQNSNFDDCGFSDFPSHLYQLHSTGPFRSMNLTYGCSWNGVHRCLYNFTWETRVPCNRMVPYYMEKLLNTLHLQFSVCIFGKHYQFWQRSVYLILCNSLQQSHIRRKIFSGHIFSRESMSFDFYTPSTPMTSRQFFCVRTFSRASD